MPSGFTNRQAFLWVRRRAGHKEGPTGEEERLPMAQGGVRAGGPPARQRTLRVLFSGWEVSAQAGSHSRAILSSRATSGSPLGGCAHSRPCAPWRPAWVHRAQPLPRAWGTQSLGTWYLKGSEGGRAHGAHWPSVAHAQPLAPRRWWTGSTPYVLPASTTCRWRSQGPAMQT